MDTRNKDFAAQLLAVQPMLYSYVLACLPNFRDWVRDVVQRINQELIRQAPRYNPARPFAPWAMTFAKNQILAFMKQQRLNRVLFDSDFIDRVSETYAAPETETDASPYGEEDYRRLELCKRRLNDRQRRLLDLRYEQNHPIEEIARLLGNKADNVKSNLCYIRKRLGECIKRLCSIIPDPEAPKLDKLDRMMTDLIEKGRLSAREGRTLAAALRSPENRARYLETINIHALLSWPLDMGRSHPVAAPHPSAPWLRLAAGLALLLVGLGWAGGALFARSRGKTVTPGAVPGALPPPSSAPTLLPTSTWKTAPVPNTIGRVPTSPIASAPNPSATDGGIIAGKSLPSSCPAKPAQSVLPRRGTLYYVATTGHDAADGKCWATAFRTPEKGVSVLADSDALLIGAGHYVLSDTLAVQVAASIRGATGRPADVLLDGNGERTICRLAHGAGLSDVTLTNGLGVSDSMDTRTGGIRIGGWDDSVTNRCVVSNCVITCCRSAKHGAGAVLLPYSLLTDSLIVNNRTTEWGGGSVGIFGKGAAVSGCRFEFNTSPAASKLASQATARQHLDASPAIETTMLSGPKAALQTQMTSQQKEKEENMKKTTIRTATLASAVAAVALGACPVQAQSAGVVINTSPDRNGRWCAVTTNAVRLAWDWPDGAETAELAIVGKEKTLFSETLAAVSRSTSVVWQAFGTVVPKAEDEGLYTASLAFYGTDGNPTGTTCAAELVVTRSAFSRTAVMPNDQVDRWKKIYTKTALLPYDNRWLGTSNAVAAASLCVSNATGSCSSTALSGVEGYAEETFNNGVHFLTTVLFDENPEFSLSAWIWKEPRGTIITFNP